MLRYTFVATMISIGAWRATIGHHLKGRISTTNKTAKLQNIPSTSIFAISILSLTIMSAALISTLLIIGGVESNPGPTDPLKDGNFKFQNIL